MEDITLKNWKKIGVTAVAAVFTASMAMGLAGCKPDEPEVPKDTTVEYQDIYDASGNLLAAANRDAKYPNMQYAKVNSVTSSFWRVSGARVTLNRITLAYKLPSELVHRVGIQSCRVNVTGQNLLSFYNPYPDNFIDPMTSYGSYPTLRKFTVGLNITF